MAKKNAHILVAMALVCAAIFLLVSFTPVVQNFFEDVSYAISPTSERAYAIGARHFDAQDPKMYDIDRAQYFFELAAAKDPTLPDVYHQMARIAFLRGDFNTAMARIDFQINNHGESDPSAYYVRGLIEGYMEDYDAAAHDYEHYLKFSPYNWAGLNDYAWVLLKAKRFKDAYEATTKGLHAFPNNPWLLNSNAIALYEMGDIRKAKIQAQRALDLSQNITLREWLHAYPGNDPRTAQIGLNTFKKATAENMHSILSSTSTGALQ